MNSYINEHCGAIVIMHCSASTKIDIHFEKMISKFKYFQHKSFILSLKMNAIEIFCARKKYGHFDNILTFCFD